jgi:hypothetical protein
MSFFGPPKLPLPTGYPLPPIESRGQALAEGDVVLIPEMPRYLVHDLPAEDVARLRTFEGKSMPILEIDGYGSVWFGEEDPWFSLQPFEVTLVAPRKKEF